MVYRIIYSLQLDLPPGPGGEIRQLIAPLRPDGSSPNIHPGDQDKRAIDLREGDDFWHRGKRETAVRIKAYRDHVSDVPPRRLRDGYVYRVRRNTHSN